MINKIKCKILQTDSYILIIKIILFFFFFGIPVLYHYSGSNKYLHYSNHSSDLTLLSTVFFSIQESMKLCAVFGILKKNVSFFLFIWENFTTEKYKQISFSNQLFKKKQNHIICSSKRKIR